jgi:Cell Wall Hydrolase
MARPMLVHAKIGSLRTRFYPYATFINKLRLYILQSALMTKNSIPDVIHLPSAAVPEKRRRRLIGGREILLVLIAFSLLALAPSIAQVVGVTRNPAELMPSKFGYAERPETNFAGSAFYFQEQDYTISPGAEAMVAGLGDSSAIIVDPATAADMPALPLETTTAPKDVLGLGGAAQPFIIRAGSPDYARAQRCLTDAIYYEAASESDAGQRAVAQVIINRMRHPTYPNNICGVVYQGSERRTGCQFSYSCDGSMARTPARASWERARNVAVSALAGNVFSPVGMATHYHTVNIYPYWAPSLHFLGTIGAHRFYRWKGSAGRPSAFFSSYAGNEPFPGPKPRSWMPSFAPATDPIQLQKQYEREYAAARMKSEKDMQSLGASAIAPAAAYSAIAPARQRPAPTYAAPSYSKQAMSRGGEGNYAGEKLPEATNIKPEYQSSGTWKSQPTG